MLLILDSRGHYPNKLVEVTEGEYAELVKVQSGGYLQDTEEGREWIKRLRARPAVPCADIVVYI